MDVKKIVTVIFLVVGYCSGLTGGNRIDRKALVTRHNVVVTELDTLSPLSVGNGRFCYTADITGMQTFPELYRRGLPLSIMSEWGWHSLPNTENYKISDVFQLLDVNGKQVPYPIGNAPGYEYLRANPHQTGLALIGLQKTDGGDLSVKELGDTFQSLDLWEGVLTSRFKLSGSPVEITTLCHPDVDGLAYKLKSSLFVSEKLGVQIRFPYPSAAFGGDPTTFDKKDSHRSEVIEKGKNYWVIKHQIDDFVYYCRLQTSGEAILKETAKHDYCLVPSSGADEFTLLVDFSKSNIAQFKQKDFISTVKANQQAWKNYWMSGGAIDLSGSKDNRWKELERRIVLSQYLTAIQSRQQYPPQETGLTCNSWYGKFHLEMHWWHSVHFALWDRTAYLANTLGWYDDIFDTAKSYTVTQGYKGVRWPKMIGPDGKESPSSVGPLLIWQQPHPIFYSELMYREKSTSETLKRYSKVIEATAEFMYDYAHWDASRECYVLGPPLISAREGNASTFLNNINSTFELTYWSWGLKKANDWKERMGQKRNPDWDRMAEKMAPWPIVNGVYVEAEAVLEKDGGHPTQLAAYGFLPESEPLDKEVMRKTLKHVMQNWEWSSTWGWDYPLIAMTAIRLNEPELALQALLKDVQKNTYLPNGHNYQDSGLPIYLPGNGGLLTVAAMMCAGWEGCNITNPGFPKDGNWDVKWEGLKPAF
ncbi:hypothetical protein [Parabacteroides timonensis]|uniref:hypothetical protein n=1 Tax=Parabacteroides timonensis TaxID=1871013 RepID=UPI0009E2A487|nr:hypothetical protein [Parabacteroides timonensis]